MSQHYKTAAVFGGTGFIGTQVVRELAKAGYRVKVATRVPERAYALKTCGNVGQVVPVACNYAEEQSIQNALNGADIVVNAIGVLFEKKRGDFERAHVDIPEKIAKACTHAGIGRFVHVSALGVDQGESKYAKTKLRGEDAVRQGYPLATIIRPSVLFGPDDDFFNMFGQIARFSPVLPLIGGGKTKFQPVFVGDVADAIMKVLSVSLAGEGNPQGKTYEIGGPDILTFKEIYQKLFEHTGRTRTLISLPYGLAKMQGCVFTFGTKIFGLITGYMPKPILTADQVEALKTDTIVSDSALGLGDLGLKPTAMDAVLSTYLKRFQPGGRFGHKESA